MMKTTGVRSLLFLIVILTSVQITFAQESNAAVVQAILFFSPTCPHCHDVIENHLPPIKEKYGNQLQLVGIDTSKQMGSKLYEDTVDALQIPQDRLGVPTLVIGEVILVGSSEIPQQLPALIETGLASGGIGWPNIPNLEESVPNLPPKAGQQSSEKPSESATEADDELMAEAIPDDADVPQEDTVGFAIGWIVMGFMILALVFAAIRLIGSRPGALPYPLIARRLGGWLVALLALAGLAIALYLAYVEVTQVAAVCGPVGECNIVQSSRYARILSVPVAILGTLYYVAVLGIWLLLRLDLSRLTRWAPNMLLGLTILGVLFSIYLTALELLVINAVCAWCLSSAVISTLLLLVSVNAFSKPYSPVPAEGTASHAV